MDAHDPSVRACCFSAFRNKANLHIKMIVRWISLHIIFASITCHRSYVCGAACAANHVAGLAAARRAITTLAHRRQQCPPSTTAIPPHHSFGNIPCASSRLPLCTLPTTRRLESHVHGPPSDLASAALTRQMPRQPPLLFLD